MRKILFLFWIVCYMLQGQAQDPTFSQFYLNDTYYNPALTGAGSGIKATISHRTQWYKLPGVFNTNYVCIDGPTGIRGLTNFGAFALKDVEGEGFLTQSQFGILMSNSLKISKDAAFSIGASLSYIEKHVDLSKFFFGDQFDAVNGYTGQSSSFNYPVETVKYPDVSIGIGGNFSIKPSKTNYISCTWGGGYHHILPNDHTFMNLGMTHPQKISAHLRLSIVKDLKKEGKNSLTFAGIYERQGNDIKSPSFETVNVGVNYLLRSRFYFGCWLRLQDSYENITYSPKGAESVILSIGTPGIGYNDALKLGYSIDYSLSSLMKTAGATHELTLIYEFQGISWRGLFNGDMTNYSGGRLKAVPCPDWLGGEWNYMMNYQKNLPKRSNRAKQNVKRLRR